MKSLLKTLGLILALSASNVKESKAEDNVLPPLEMEYTSSHMHANLLGTDYDIFERTEFDGKKSCLSIYKRTNPLVGLTLEVFTGLNGTCDGNIDAIVQTTIDSNYNYFMFCEDDADSREKCDKMQSILKPIENYASYVKKIWYEKRDNCSGICKLIIKLN